MGNLSHVKTMGSFKAANPGLIHTYQLINVEDYEGKGETAPTPYFYQNVGEAEYMVALFQFLILIGYPAEKISMLTTYNGQKALLQDIWEQRCGAGTPFQGKFRPRAISTVDQYQGQQNEICLLSLVRTDKTIGHLRDVRRLVVAVSRARLGLYVFCRQSLFVDCPSLKPTFELLTKRPSKLELVLNEQYPTATREVGDFVGKNQKFVVTDVSHMGSIVHSMQEQWVAP